MGGQDMAEAKAHILLVEDNPPMARVCREYLRNEPYEVTHVESGQAAIAALDANEPEAILLDLKLPDMDGLEILRRVRAARGASAVVIITAYGSIDTAVKAMREGAYDFIIKPFSADRLIYTLRNALERHRLSTIVASYQEDRRRDRYFGFIGSSLAVQEVYQVIDNAAPSVATVFLTGETGSGKEVCAEAVHRKSPRRNKPYVAINCAAIPKDLMESEIFGHVKGAFTGAVSTREGAAGRADGGTLFLDEVCDMPIDLQTKLLRFVQTGSFIKVGGTETERVDVRFICSTNRDPLREVELGRFREDLYYRLHVIPIHLPPLREREDDVLTIARHFLHTFAREEGKAFTAFAPETEAVLKGYDWPGNVRQLQNVVRNAVVLNEGETVTPEMLPRPLGTARDAPATPAPRSPSGSPAGSPPGPAAGSEAEPGTAVRPLWQVERKLIRAALEQTGGNVPLAAALLQINPSTIYRKLAKWEAEETE
jgi:DNA-binding NtrC family response regulator